MLPMTMTYLSSAFTTPHGKEKAMPPPIRGRSRGLYVSLLVLVARGFPLMGKETALGGGETTWQRCQWRGTPYVHMICTYVVYI
jgi:hypothetical protein